MSADDDLWQAAEHASDAVEAWVAERARCRAVLFPLEPPRDIVGLVVCEAWANGVPVHPRMVPYGAAVQGPRPVACARGPHPGSPWHWCDGTWWRERTGT